MATQIDQFDRKLLRLLQEDARLTNNELSERVNLSASQCSRRRMRLEQAGIIKAYRADLDREKLHVGIVNIITVTLATHNRDNARRFARLVGDLPEVLEAYALTGEMDYIIKVVTADLKGLSSFVNEVLLPHEFGPARQDGNRSRHAEGARGPAALKRPVRHGGDLAGEKRQFPAKSTIRDWSSTMAKLQAGIIPVTPFQQNCTVLFDPETKRGVVVDPGGDVEVITQVLRENGLTIEAIWLTHGHIDHAGGAVDLKAELGVDIVGPHKDDARLLAGLEDQARMFGLDGPVKNVTPDRWLSEGDSVSFGEHEFQVFHTPGHAPGHVIYFNRAENIAHLGDVLFSGSIGRTDLPGGNHEQLLASIRDKVLPLGDDVGFICGHGPGGRIGEERRTNPFLKGM